MDYWGVMVHHSGVDYRCLLNNCCCMVRNRVGMDNSCLMDYRLDVVVNDRCSVGDSNCLMMHYWSFRDDSDCMVLKRVIRMMVDVANVTLSDMSISELRVVDVNVSHWSCVYVSNWCSVNVCHWRGIDISDRCDIEVSKWLYSHVMLPIVMRVRVSVIDWSYHVFSLNDCSCGLIRLLVVCRIVVT